MAESLEVRLVRCPKCENLLPELSDYSFYQCGGCGAVLRAKYDEGYGNGSMLEKPDEENIGEDYAKSDNLFDKEAVDSSDPSDIKVKSNSGSSRYTNLEKEHNEHEVFANGVNVNRSKEKVVKLVGSEQEGPMSSQMTSDEGPKFSGRMSDWRNRERAEIWRKSQADIEGMRFSTSNHPEGGTSSSYSGFPYNFGEPWRNQRDFDGANRVHNLEQDRAELLRKLDELKNKLSQSSDMACNPIEEVHVDDRMVPPDPYGGFNNAWLPQRLSELNLNGTSRQIFRPENHPVGPSNFSHGPVKSNGANFSSDDYSGYDFHAVDKEPVLPAADPSLNSGKSQETSSFHSSSLNTSEGKNSPEVMIDPREVIQSTQHPTMGSLSSPPAGSPLKDYFDYSNNNHALTQFEKGSRLEQEKVKVDKIKTRQNSLKDVVLATEMDVHDYCNTGVSEESNDVRQKHNQPKAIKGGDSFIANIIKKGFRDFSRSHDERERSNVTVNGEPLQNSVIKKAEKLAGPIQPGNYWYDFRAGFWGVMGGPCLGIIPPHIEELRYPMPENCAGGSTGVFVNGRELHEKDLNLLAGRGLPTERDRSYIIEISGRVLDEDTGDELDCLGKLAPTVEKVKHGFGMKPPRAAP